MRNYLLLEIYIKIIFVSGFKRIEKTKLYKRKTTFID